MQKGAKSGIRKALPGHAAERNQMIVVNPDKILAIRNLRDRACELAIHVSVGSVGFFIEADRVQTQVEQRPKAAIGEFIVIAV